MIGRRGLDLVRGLVIVVVYATAAYSAALAISDTYLLQWPDTLSIIAALLLTLIALRFKDR